MKKFALIGAASALALSAAPAFAQQDNDNDDPSDNTATLELIGTVSSNCSIGWGGYDSGDQDETYEFDLTEGALDGPENDYQLETPLGASCNGPYSVTVQSENGHLEHSSDDTRYFGYFVDFTSDEDGVDERISASDMDDEGPQEIYSISSNDFIDQNASSVMLDIGISLAESTADNEGDASDLISGEYVDTLTFEVTPDELFEQDDPPSI